MLGDRVRRSSWLPVVLAGLSTVAVGVVASWPAPAGAQSGFGEIRPEPKRAPLPTLAPLAPPAGSAAPAPSTPVESPAPAGSASPERPKGQEPALPESRFLLLILGLGAVVIVATVFVVMAVLLKRPFVLEQPPPRSSAPEGPAPADYLDSGFVRMGRPPEGTLKILPGRFSVEDGDRLVDLHIFRTTGADRVETTVGRAPGDPYRHIQLKPLSVSAEQAKFVFENRAYSIVNLTDVNPTLVNGEVLQKGASRRLVDEDRVEFGEVAMTYHER